MIQIISQRHAPRFFVFIIDLLICVASVVTAYVLRFEFNLQDIVRSYDILWAIPIIAITRAISFVIFHTYSGIIRYTTTQDAARILVATTTSSAILFGFFYFAHHINLLSVPRSIALIDYVVTSFALIGARIAYKALHGLLLTETQRAKIAILGQEKEVLQVKRTLDRDLGAGAQTVAIFLTNTTQNGSKLEGTPVYAAERIPLALKEMHIEKLIIANELEDEQLHEKMVDTCLRHHVGDPHRTEYSAVARRENGFPTSETIRCQRSAYPTAHQALHYGHRNEPDCKANSRYRSSWKHR